MNLCPASNVKRINSSHFTRNDHVHKPFAPHCRRTDPSRRRPRAALAAPIGKPVAGQQVHFPNGTWSGLPQTGPDGKVRQCVMVALRQRVGRNGPIDTRFSVNISRGTGLAIMIEDDGLPSEQVLDDQAELSIENRAFPAVYFPIGNAQVFHPGDAAVALAALGKATQLKLRSEGAGLDSGEIKINLPPASAELAQAVRQDF